MLPSALNTYFDGLIKDFTCLHLYLFAHVALARAHISAPVNLNTSSDSLNTAYFVLSESTSQPTLLLLSELALV